MVLVGIGMALAAQAKADLIFNFQENGSNTDLGPTSTFTEGGVSLTASGFLNSGAVSNLYAKSLGGDEIGLGMSADPTGQNEIFTGGFVQLTLPTTPPAPLSLILTGSVQPGEQALVYFSPTAGSFTAPGAQLIGTISDANNSVAIPPGDQNGFIDITAGGGNVLLASATVVPESGTIAFLGVGLALAGLARLGRTLRAFRS